MLRACGIVVAVALLAGCSSVGKTVPAVVTADLNVWSSSVDAQASELAAAPAPALVPQAPGSPHDEVLAFADLYQRGLGGNHRIDVARQQISVADAEVMNAVFSFFPSLSGTLNKSFTHQNILNSDNVVFQQGEAQYGVFNAGLQARLPIIDAENVFNLRKTEAGRRKSYAEYIDAAQTYMRDLMLAYLDLAEANAIIAEYEELETLLSRRVALEQGRQAESAGNVEITLNYQQQLNDVRAHLITDRARRNSVLIRIYELTGIRVSGVRGSVNVDGLQLPSQNAQDLLTLALRNNPRHVAKQHDVDIFDEELRRSAAADFGPTLDAFGTYEYEDRGGSQFGGGSTTTQGVVGLELRVPLFNAGGSGYQSATAKARRVKVDSELALVRREIESSLLMAYANFLSARERIAIEGRTVDQGTRLVHLVNQRVEGGSATREISLEARIEQASFKRQRAQWQFQMLREWIAIKHLVGDLSERDVVVFSAH